MRRDYEQNNEPILPAGYIAWFDALDNLNNGSHSNSTLRWNDRTGDYYVTCQERGGFEWGNNYMRSWTNGQSGVFEGPTGSKFDIGTGDFTLVAVNFYPNTNVNTTYEVGEIAHSGDTSTRWNIACDSDLHLWQGNRGKIVQYNCNYSNKNICHICRRTSGVVNQYANGNLINTANYAYSLGTPAYSRIRIGGSANAKFYCGIVYKRALSDAELTQLQSYLSNYYNLTFDAL